MKDIDLGIEKVCYRCKKEFLITCGASNYAYKKGEVSPKYFCSYSCLNKFNNENVVKSYISRHIPVVQNENLMDGKSLTDYQANKRLIIEMLNDGYEAIQHNGWIELGGRSFNGINEKVLDFLKQNAMEVAKCKLATK